MRGIRTKRIVRTEYKNKEVGQWYSKSEKNRSTSCERENKTIGQPTGDKVGQPTGDKVEYHCTIIFHCNMEHYIRNIALVIVDM